MRSETINTSKSTVTILIVFLIAVFILLSLLFRIVLPYDSIFTGDSVKMSSNDAYYHMRLVDNLAYNFPHITAFDPFYIFPGGSTTGGGVHFLEYLMAFITWIIGLGSPTQHTIDLVGAYFPPFLAALTVIPVFFIGKTLFNRWAGLLAALLIAIMPGEFMGRSVIGSADTPPAEVFFSTMTIMFLILALKATGAFESGQSPLTFGHLRQGNRKTLVKPLVYSLLAGLFLGIYLITWMGALLFVFIICLYLLIQFIINQFNQKSSDHLGIVGFIVFFIALIIFLPISPNMNLSLAMAAAVFVPLVLTSLSGFISSRSLKPYYYPLSLAAAGILVIGLFYAVNRDIVTTLWNNFLFVFAPGGSSTAETTQEMQPLLSPLGSFTTILAWGNFTTGFFLLSATPPDWLMRLFPGFALIPIAYAIWIRSKQPNVKQYQGLITASIIIALILAAVFWFITPIEWKLCFPGFGIIAFTVLLWQVIKARGKNEPILFFIIWTSLAVFATLAQRRFAYYSVVTIALLTAFISCQIIWWAGLKKLVEKQAVSPVADKAGSSRAKIKRRQGLDPPRHIAYAIIAAIIVIPLATFWNITTSKETASVAPYTPSEGWEESLTWMKNNTPDPLGDPDAYYKLIDADFEYPASAYGVTAWWDYGYWISRIAHRLPSTNPSQAPKPIIKVANLFLSTDEADANKIMDELDSSYIITDYGLATRKFWAVVNWAGQDEFNFYAFYLVQYQGSWRLKRFYYPAYYNSIAAKMFNSVSTNTSYLEGTLQGKTVPGTPLVLTLKQEVLDDETTYYKVINAKRFPSYQAAQQFITSQTSGIYDIVGSNPLVNPVPVETLENSHLVHSSQSTVLHSDLDWNQESQTWEYTITEVPEIKIFQHSE